MRNNAIFKMPKFRSMRVGTPAVATHLLADPTGCGREWTAAICDLTMTAQSAYNLPKREYF